MPKLSKRLAPDRDFLRVTNSVRIHSLFNELLHLISIMKFNHHFNHFALSSRAVCAAIAASASVVSAGEIYTHTFDGDGTNPLNGVNSTTGGGTWIANRITDDDGTMNNGEGSAVLPFEPVVNETYTLSMELTHAGTNDWVGLGFASDGLNNAGGDSATDRFSTTGRGVSWMIYRDNATDADDVQIFAGTGTGNQIADTAVWSAGLHILKIVLDTTGDGTNFTADYFIDDVSISNGPQTVDLSIDSINWVGFTSADDTSGDNTVVDNFSLSDGSIDEPIVLAIAQVGSNLDFTWNSEPGMQYDLLSSTELSTAPSGWAPYNDGVSVFEDIATSGTGTNTLTGVLFSGDRRFFAILAEELPPLLSIDFEGNDGGFTAENKTTGAVWAWGAPNSSSPGGAVTAGNDGSTNCWGTDIGDPGQYPAGTSTCLRSSVIDLTNVTSATLSFYEALDVEANDTAEVYIVDDITDTVIAGPIFTSVDSDIGAAPWSLRAAIAFPAEAYGQEVRVEFRFTGNGGPNEDYMGWYIDDVLVEGF